MADSTRSFGAATCCASKVQRSCTLFRYAAFKAGALRSGLAVGRAHLRGAVGTDAAARPEFGQYAVDPGREILEGRSMSCPLNGAAEPGEVALPIVRQKCTTKAVCYVN
jgi:hypothetical protein